MYELIDKDASITGTSLQGYIEATYDDLVKAFGEPTFDSTKGDEGDKVHTHGHWSLRTKKATWLWLRSTIGKKKMLTIVG